MLRSRRPTSTVTAQGPSRISHWVEDRRCLRRQPRDGRSQPDVDACPLPTTTQSSPPNSRTPADDPARSAPRPPPRHQPGRPTSRHVPTSTGCRTAPRSVDRGAASRRGDSVPLAADEPTERDEPDEHDDQAYPQAPEDHQQNPGDHDEAADRDAGDSTTSFRCCHLFSPPSFPKCSLGSSHGDPSCNARTVFRSGTWEPSPDLWARPGPQAGGFAQSAGIGRTWRTAPDRMTTMVAPDSSVPGREWRFHLGEQGTPTTRRPRGGVCSHGTVRHGTSQSRPSQ
jgi:hypothetical protein